MDDRWTNDDIILQGCDTGGGGMRDHHCDPCKPFRTVFCPTCGAADKAALKRTRLMGFVGPAHSTSPKIEAFLESGDPAHLS